MIKLPVPCIDTQIEPNHFLFSTRGDSSKHKGVVMAKNGDPNPIRLRYPSTTTSSLCGGDSPPAACLCVVTVFRVGEFESNINDDEFSNSAWGLKGSIRWICWKTQCSTGDRNHLNAHIILLQYTNLMQIKRLYSFCCFGRCWCALQIASGNVFNFVIFEKKNYLDDLLRS